MNLILLEPDEITGDQVVLEGRRAAHVRDVHRATVARKLRAGVIGSSIGSATVTSVSADRIVLALDEMQKPPPEPLPLTLVLALPRPKVVNRTLAAAASLGIKRIEIINAWRVEKSYWSTPKLQPDSIREQLILGLEQGVDSILPEVRIHRFFRRFVEEELRAVSAGAPVLVAHPRVSTGPPPVERCVLVIGPEGGFIEDELRLLREHGAETFSAGERILRVETAVPYLVALTLGSRQ